MKSNYIRRHIIYYIGAKSRKNINYARIMYKDIGWSNRRGGDLYKGRFVETFQLPYGQKHCSGVI